MYPTCYPLQDVFLPQCNRSSIILIDHRVIGSYFKHYHGISSSLLNSANTFLSHSSFQYDDQTSSLIFDYQYISIHTSSIPVSELDLWHYSYLALTRSHAENSFSGIILYIFPNLLKYTGLVLIVNIVRLLTISVNSLHADVSCQLKSFLFFVCS